MKHLFDIRKLIAPERQIPEGALEVRGYILHKFSQFENLTNRFILDAIQGLERRDIYHTTWGPKETKFFEALISVGIHENTSHYDFFKKTLSKVVPLRHAMAHWIWTIAESEEEEITIKFEEPEIEPLIITNNSILEFKENCEKLESTLTIIYLDNFDKSESA